MLCKSPLFLALNVTFQIDDAKHGTHVLILLSP